MQARPGLMPLPWNVHSAWLGIPCGSEIAGSDLQDDVHDLLMSHLPDQFVDTLRELVRYKITYKTIGGKQGQATPIATGM